MPENTIRKAHCFECGGIRRCRIRGKFTIGENDEYSQYWSSTSWYILECRGCGYTFVQTSTINSEEYSPNYDNTGQIFYEHDELLAYWPALSKRQRPDWIKKSNADLLDAEKLKDALTELYGALDNGLSMLAAIGIRTCFDIASEVLNIDPGLTFAEKLDALVAAKHIRQMDRDRLETAVEVGNATAHRGWKPLADDLDTMAQVLEEFVSDTFVQPRRRKALDEKAAKVRGTVPPRPGRKKKKGGSAPPSPLPGAAL